MKLTIDTLKNITFGYEKIIEENGFFTLVRFNDNELNAYKTYKDIDLYEKCFSQAGVRFSFITNAEKLSFDYKLAKSSSRKFAYFDVYENGNLTNHFGISEFDSSINHIDINLTSGEKHLEIYLPWSLKTDIANIEITDNATIIPKKRNASILCYGDSITHGYDAIYPSLSYSSRIAKMLDCDIVNKAIGGEIFFPELAKAKNDKEYDIVTVAYGSNDWSKCSLDVFENNVKNFFLNLYNANKNSKIFVITPIRRGDTDRLPLIGVEFLKIHDIISNYATAYENIKVIKGIDLAPHFDEFYSDKYLHPNDLGFSIYAENLYKEILKNSL